MEALQARLRAVTGGDTDFPPPKDNASLRGLSITLGKLETAVDGTDDAPSADAVAGFDKLQPVLANGTVTFKAQGTCILDANVPGDSTYKPAEKQHTFVVRPQSGGAITGNIGYVSAGAKHRTIKFSYTAPPGGTASKMPNT